ncbi:MAG: hypothetical protein methR_P3215 [Methyloprofundus sp.]|nr:MAG: hypothetical protein methR_P3215 [Methyloprofundus sp.]
MISKLSEIGVIGMGRFGTLISNIFQEDFDVYCYDPEQGKGTNVFNMVSLQYAASREIVVYCVPILKFKESVSETVPYIRKDAHVLDVLSVKKYPYEVMTNLLPDTVSILPTHPMFGPDSIKNGRDGLPFVLCPEEKTNKKTLAFFPNIYKEKGFLYLKHLVMITTK